MGLLGGNDELDKLTVDELLVADIEISFGVETLFDSYDGCSIKIDLDQEPLYNGVSPTDFLLDIINKIKGLIPEKYIIEKKPEEYYSEDENPNFQFIAVILNEPIGNRLLFLIPPIYIKSVDCWLKLHNIFLKEEAKKTISIT